MIGGQVGSYGISEAQHAAHQVVESPAIARSMDALESRMNEIAKAVEALAYRLTPVLRPATSEMVGVLGKDALAPLRSPLVDMIWSRTEEATIIIRRLSEMMDALEL